MKTAFSGHDVVIDAGISGSKDHFKVFDRSVPHPDVVCDRIFKKDDVLVDNGDRTGKNVPVDPGSRLSVKQDLTAPWPVKP